MPAVIIDTFWRIVYKGKNALLKERIVVIDSSTSPTMVPNDRKIGCRHLAVNEGNWSVPLGTYIWGLGLLGVVASLARRIAGGVGARKLHHAI